MEIPSTKQRRRSASLPEEIIELILFKLPTKSLLRFKSVRKQWLSLISDPTFVKSHLKHVHSYHNYFLNQKTMIVSSDSSRFFTLNHDGKAVLQYNLPLVAPDGIHVLGSCHGLFCLGILRVESVEEFYRGRYDPILCINPSFRDHKVLPFSVPYTLADWFGFGYDSHTDDYKLVRVNSSTDMAEVYTLQMNSRRSFQIPSYLSLAMSWDVGTVFNGFLYWIAGAGIRFDLEMAGGDDQDNPMLVWFNLRYEKFMLRKLPDFASPMKRTKLIVVRDCLGIFSNDYESGHFNLFMMKEDGLNGISWSKVKIQHPEGKVSWPVCLLMNGEILTRVEINIPSSQNPKNELIIYNPQGGTLQNIAIHGAGNWWDYTTYIETLVLPP